MNQQPPSRPSRRAKSTAQKFTSQQIILLVLFAILGSATLILAAFMLLPSRPAGTAPAPVSQVGPTLPRPWTPQPGNAAPSSAAADEAATPGSSQPLPVLPASCAQAGSGFIQGTVAQVVDGGTLEILVADRVLPISYAGIEVPAESEPARQKAQEMLAGQAVTLVKDVTEKDSAGRMVRYVFAGDRFINYELVRQGLAVAQPNSPDQACASFLQQAQQQARAERLGLWNATPVPTKTFVPLVTLDPSKQSGCDCSKKYLCSDFNTHAEAQACLNLCNDYSSKLDDDRDGIACENLP